MQVIESNIQRFLQKTDHDAKHLLDLQHFVAKTYINNYKLKPIDSSLEIVGENKLQVTYHLKKI